MTLQQIKYEVAALSEADRLALRAFLIHLDRVDDPWHRHELGKRMKHLETAGKTSLDEFIRLNTSEGSQGS